MRTVDSINRTITLHFVNAAAVNLRRKTIGAIPSRIMSLGVILLLLLVGPNILSQARDLGVVKDTQEIKLGETVTRPDTGLGQAHIYRFELEAGTSVECSLGDRDIGISLTVGTPGDLPGSGNNEAGTVDAGRIVGSSEGLVEPLVIVSDKTGKYTIRAAAYTGPGTYSISCREPHATTERDRKYFEAQRLMLEVRRATNGSDWRFLNKVADKIVQRAEIYRRLGDKKSLALSIMDVGFLHYWNFEITKAMEPYREAQAIFSSLNSPVDVIRAKQWLSTLSEAVGDFQGVFDRKTEILTISRSLNSKQREVGALVGLGVTYHRLADEQKARDYYEQALAISTATNPPTLDSLRSQVLLNTNFGNLYRGMNGGEVPIDFFPIRTESDRLKALESYKRALELDAEIERLFPPNQGMKWFNLWQMGNTLKELGRFTEALNYLDQAQVRYRSTKDDNALLRVLHDISDVYVKKGEFPKAIVYLDQALSILRDKDYPFYLSYLAKEYYQAGDTAKGRELLEEALTYHSRNEQNTNAAEDLFEIARIERELGNFNNARTRIEDAIRITESLRTKITAQDLRTTYFSTVKRYYDSYIDLLMQAHKSQPEKNYDTLALKISENARSRGLLDLLSISGVDIKQGVEPDLLAREKQVRDRLAAKANQQSRLLLSKHSDAEAAAINKEVTDLSDDYTAVETEIKNKSPRYAALTQPKSIDTKQIQRLLDSGTVLLEYSLGEKKSYLWAVTPDSVTSFDLPGRIQIETAAKKVHGLMTERNRQMKGETDEQRRSRIKQSESEYPKAASELAKMLLGPAASQIRNKRLVVVPDGALNYVSFAALPPPPNGDEASSAGMIALGVNHEIVTLPSASILARLREEGAVRESAPKMLAVFADPVFNEVDSRTANAGTRQVRSLTASAKTRSTAESRDFERAISDVGLSEVETGGLPRLSFSRREADSIFTLSPKSLSLKRTDFEASKSEVFKSGLDKYRILHFATHGLLDSQHPELSGVVLSLVDRDQSEIDGFLRLQDIYNLKLNADLVVLSACNTALGKEVKGEGLIGLTRGFMYAGAPRIVASLWKVDDAATAELMTIFYRKMLVENLRPAAALRAAQNEMMKNPRWKSPYYWAPFVLQGEWK